MQDQFKIDGHKLIYHPQRVAGWLNDNNIYPLYMEISPTGMCNLRCVFCSVDFMGYQNRSLATEVLVQRLEEMGRLGLKAIMYAGEGEPFLHKDMAEIIVHTKKAGIDAAVTTNGVLMKPSISEKILGHTEWIKVSCNAGTPETYAKVHRTKEEDFQKVLDNLAHAVEVRREMQYNCTLGMQILLLPENEHEVVGLAALARDLKLDYLVVKPYTHHFRNEHEYSVTYEKYADLSEELKKLNTSQFSTIFRSMTMQRWDKRARDYACCHAMPFWSYIDAGGNVWGCSAHLEEEKFLYGNIYDETFQAIWEGEKRKVSLEWAKNSLDIKTCKLNCRMDAINNYLNELQNPIAHKNFI